MKAATRQRLEYALTLAGAILLVYLVHRIGAGTLWAHLTAFGPWFLATGAIAGGWLFLQGTAWRIVQNRFGPRVPLAVVLRARVISDGFNLILPSASLGGDAMRAHLIRDCVPLRNGVPGVLFDKTVEFAASVVFISTALVLGLLTTRVPAGLVVASGVSLAITTAGIALLVAAQRTGVTSVLRRVGRLVPSVERLLRHREEPLQALDANLRLLWSGSGRAAVGPLALHLAARVAGGVEVGVIMAVLGAPVTVIEALYISALVTVGNTVFFLLPGQWGVAESVHVVVVQSLGYPPSVGLSLALIRRIRRLAFVALAVALMGSRGRTLTNGSEIHDAH